MLRSMCRGRSPQPRLGRAQVTVAAVDIGTNTVRCLVGDETGEIDRLEFVTGLGRGVDATGRLSDDAIERTIAALENVSRSVAEAVAMRVVATSASRDAANRPVFFAAVERVLGQEPELLSGSEEAALSFRGATARSSGRLSTVIDLGGGSTEIVSGRIDPEFVRSFDIGSVRITDRHLASRPVPQADLAAARQTIRTTVRELPAETGEILGVGGTFQTLGLMLTGSNDGVAVSLDRLEALVDRLTRMSISETAAIDGVLSGRERVILGGALIASVVLSMLEAEAVAISRHDLLDGMVAQLLAQSPGE